MRPRFDRQPQKCLFVLLEQAGDRAEASSFLDETVYSSRPISFLAIFVGSPLFLLPCSLCVLLGILFFFSLSVEPLSHLPGDAGTLSEM